MTTRPICHCLSVFPLLFLAPVAFADDKPVKGTARGTDGLTIAYDVRGKGDSALVFLHGWCGDREVWKHQLDAFAVDYRVVAIDQAGHGESGKDRKHWTVTGLAGDVEAVIKHLPLKRVILIGHSMGGPVSLATAKRLPGVVVAVIGADTLQNADVKFPEEQAKQIAQGFEADFNGSMQAGIRGMLPENVDPKLRDWIVTKAASQDKTMAIALFRDFSNIDTKALMREAKVPVRCINAGPGAQFFTPTAPDVNKKYADFKAVIMEGVGHFPMLEKPAEFNGHLREVLKEFERK